MSTAASASTNRRWLFVLAGFTVVLIPGIIALQIVLMQRFAPRNRPESAATSSEENEPPTKPGAGNKLPEPKKTPAVEKSLVKPGTPDPLLEALGSLTGAHLYQSYLNLGLLADAVESEVYTREQARDMLATIGSTMDTVDKQLARIPPSHLGDAEKKHLERVHELLALLKTQTRELKAYWDTEKQEHADRYQKARKEALDGIRTLLDSD
jgi:hypothetical protein